MDQMSHKRSDSPIDSWEPCPPGALSQLAQSEGRRQSMSRSLTMAGAAVGGSACVLLLLGSMGWVGLNSLDPLRGSPFESGSRVSGSSVNYSCRDTIESRDGFLLGNASPEAQAAVREHLAHCAHCRAAFRQRAQELKVEYTVLVTSSSAVWAFASR